MARKKSSKNSNEVMKYAGMATQMAVSIFMGIWLGKKADVYFELDKPYFTLLGALIMLVAIFILIFKDLTKR